MLWYAVEHSDIKLIKSLNFIHFRNDDNYTPLHLAVNEGNLEVVKVLIEKDIDVNSEA
jgi:ankyrin repeat protein